MAKKKPAKKASTKKVAKKAVKKAAKKAAPKKQAKAAKSADEPESELEVSADGAGLDGAGTGVIHVDDMYSDWFLDYASYVILERAVPHLDDGLKPVQRRIMHSLHELDDGRYNKVANVVGNTMKYHPHGDASIGDAMVQLGQKDLLIDTQGNWGNLLTGDRAAAPRYIEARLSKFAIEVVFSPKITEWARSYDGRNKEPVTLPVKFPLLLAQGVEGIAVGLSSKILPHNFIELCDACIASLRKKPFELFPDFATGGLIDATDYNEGLRGGRVRCRARIERTKKKAELLITEIPFGTTTTSLMESIVNANDKGKIKISKLEDNTSDKVEIRIVLPSGVDPDQMEQAMYAFTDCEVSIAPNSCVVANDKPQFLPVSKLVRYSAERSRDLLLKELEIKLGELKEKHLFSSLEKIFIENRIYRDIEECETWEAVMQAVWDGLNRVFKEKKIRFYRKITDEDIERLLEIRIKRISKYDKFKADELIYGLEQDIKEVEKNIRNITRFTVKWFEDLKKKYGKGRERKSELTQFAAVVKTQVAVATETLYLDAKEGFAGFGIRKDSENLGKCSRMDDIIIIGADGGLRVSKVEAKFNVGKRPAYVAVFRKDEATKVIYNLIYRDGRQGKVYVKRFRVGGVTRDKVYDIAQGKPGTRILHLTVHDTEESSNEDAPTVVLEPAPRLRTTEIPVAFSDYAIKGRGVRGNVLTDKKVAKVLKRG